MIIFYIALPWVALFIASSAELKSDGDGGFATLALVVAILVLGLVMFGAKLGSAA